MLFLDWTSLLATTVFKAPHRFRRHDYLVLKKRQ